MRGEVVGMTSSTRGEPRIAIIGCGALTELFYAPALATLGRKRPVKVATLIDPNPARVAALQPLFPGSVGGASLADLPDHIDLAIIASPAGFHASQTVALLGRGMHVFCEKPMARSSVECDAMIAAARAADRLLRIGHFKRFFPATQQIKELVERQTFGRLLDFHFFDGGKFGWPAQSRSLFDREAGGGGVLIDIGVHAIDLALWWFGEPTEVACADDAMGGVEANAAVTLRYANGANGKLIASRDVDTPNRYVMRFERGWVAWNPIDANHIELGWGERYALKAQTHEASTQMRLPAAGAEAPSRHQAFMLQIDAMLDAMQGIGAIGVSGEDGRRVMALIDRCYASSTLIDMPWLSAAERQKAMELRCSR
jgi:predicted dehydrogenase